MAVMFVRGYKECNITATTIPWATKVRVDSDQNVPESHSSNGSMTFGLIFRQMRSIDSQEMVCNHRQHGQRS